jgi:hypothetical protein
VSEDKSSKADYWKMKKEDLMSLAMEKEVPFDPDKLDRKAVIDALIIKDAEAGLLTEGIEVSDEGSGPVRIQREYVDIVFHNQEGHPKYQFLGLQGRCLYLPRECVCRIPIEFLDVVKEAVENKLIPHKVDDKLTYKEVKVPRISYEVIGRGVI